jgi:hypothetical protein
VENGNDVGRNWTKGQRKRGVKREAREKKNEKSTKILLTEIGGSKDTLDAPVTAFPTNVPTFLSYPHAGKKSARSTGVGTIEQRRDEFARNGSGSHTLQDLRFGSVPDAHGELPPLRARIASAIGVPDSSPGTAGGSSR